MYIGDTGRYPYGPAPAGRGSPVRQGTGLEPGQTTRGQGRRGCLQHGIGGRPRRASTGTACSGGRRRRTRGQGPRRGEPIGPCRGDRHRRCDRFRSVRTGGRRDWCRRRADRRRLPRLRRVRRAWPDGGRRDHDPRRATARSGQGRRRSTPVARVHPLPVPGPSDRRGDGPRRDPGVERRRDGVRDPRDVGAARSAFETRPPTQPSSIASTRAATSPGSPISVAACSAPSSAPPINGIRRNDVGSSPSSTRSSSNDPLRRPRQ